MSDDLRSRVLEAAQSFRGIPYRLDPPPDGVTTIDCSLFVIKTFAKAGIPFGNSIRTAEQIRQACTPVAWDDVQPADLLFFAGTYNAGGPPGPDGKIASHVGFSLGRGSSRMLDAHERAGPDVAETAINTAYWQSKLIEARRWVPAQPSPKPTPGTKRMKVDATGLNVRESPNTSARVLGTLQEGAIVQANPRAWRWVETGVLKGWVADEYLEDA